jgi:hypothetical protein
MNYFVFEASSPNCDNEIMGIKTHQMFECEIICISALKNKCGKHQHANTNVGWFFFSFFHD